MQAAGARGCRAPERYWRWPRRVVGEGVEGHMISHGEKELGERPWGLSVLEERGGLCDWLEMANRNTGRIGLGVA
eukprot:scaffold88906_cov30-Tisochrysis_lutea.AAC.10